MKQLQLIKNVINLNFQRSCSSKSGEIYTSSDFQNGIRKITMCHGKTRNSLSVAMMENLLKEIDTNRDDPQLRAIVLAGDGPIFSAGHNLKELTEDCGRAQHMHIFNLCAKLMDAIVQHPVPIIARVDGLAAAAGCQLVAQCDLAVCTEKSKFSTPGANFGIFCSTPGIALTRSVNKSTALKMLLTGEHITSDEAKSSGLVAAVAPTPEALDEEINKLCNAIRSKSRAVIELGKRFYYKQIREDLKTAYNLGGNVMVDNINGVDGKEGIKSFSEKRKPVWRHEI